MKISNNMSRRSFLLQLWILRTLAIVFLVIAIFQKKYFADMIGFSVILLVASMISYVRRNNFLLEVYDFGDFLKLKLDQEEVLVNLNDIENIEIRDGKDGLDWVVIHLYAETKFGRLIQFYPNMVNIPMARLDIWLLEMNRRIASGDKEVSSNIPTIVQHSR